jgi:hypothetical protein
MDKLSRSNQKMNISFGRVVIALLAILCLTCAKASAGEVYLGVGSLYRYYNADGKIGWTGWEYGDGTVKMEYIPFDAENAIEFVPDFDYVGSGYDGLGWPGKTKLTGEFLLGFRFSDYVALQGTFQLSTSMGTSHSELGWTGAAIFTETAVTSYRHSSLSVELKLHPWGNWLYLVGGLERTHGTLEIHHQMTTEFSYAVETYSYSLGDGKTQITPIVGAGAEKYFGRNLGMFAQATYSSSKYTNLKDGKATIDIYPNMEFDTGGLGISIGVLMKLRSNWR